MAGGLTAVIWTDFIQTVLMIIGAVVLAILGANYANRGDLYNFSLQLLSMKILVVMRTLLTNISSPRPQCEQVQLLMALNSVARCQGTLCIF